MRLKILLSIYFFLCLAIFIVRTAHWKQVNDPAQLNYLCFLMDHGMAPYRDLLEVNMPGIYLVNWSVMHTLGGGSAAWRIFDLGLMGIRCLGHDRDCATVWTGWPVPWGATMFILFHGKDGAGQEGQRDLIIAVLLLCGVRISFYFFFVVAAATGRYWRLACVQAWRLRSSRPRCHSFVLLAALAAFRLWRAKGASPETFDVCRARFVDTPFVVVGVFLFCKHSLSAFWYLLHVEMPFYSSLGRVPGRKLVGLMASASIRTLALIAGGNRSAQGG